jgi:hypothetical protein
MAIIVITNYIHTYIHVLIAENSILFVFRIGKNLMFQAIGYERWRNIDLTGQIAYIS